MSYFGSSWPVFFGFTVVLMGFAALMTGRAMADGWRPFWHLIFYCLMMGAADRFLVFALFGGDLLSIRGFLFDSVVLFLISAVSFRITRTHRMITQYPWLYQRAGLLNWEERAETESS